MGVSRRCPRLAVVDLPGRGTPVHPPDRIPALVRDRLAREGTRVFGRRAAGRLQRGLRPGTRGARKLRKGCAAGTAGGLRAGQCVEGRAMNRSIRTVGMLLAAVLALSACDFFTSPETRIARATEQITAGDFRPAVFELRKVLEDEPGRAQARLLLAEAEYGSGDIAS